MAYQTTEFDVLNILSRNIAKAHCSIGQISVFIAEYTKLFIGKYIH